jgi:hypothetical protein
LSIPEVGIFLGCDSMFDAGATSSYSCRYPDPGPLVYFYLVGGTVPEGGLPAAGVDAGPLTPLEITGMPFVTPNDPSNSFLMHKMDDDQCTLSNCVVNNVPVLDQLDYPGGPNSPSNWCGQSMPYNAALLPASPACGGSQDCTATPSYARDTVRLWIAQGALNN